MPAESSSLSKAFTSNMPVLYEDIHAAHFEPETLGLLKTLGIESACWLPLTSHERMVGTLMVASRTKSAFTQRELDMLMQIASQVAAAVDNAVAFSQIAELSEKLQREKQYLEEELNTEHQFDDIIGHSNGLKRVLKAGGNGCAHRCHRAGAGRNRYRQRAGCALDSPSQCSSRSNLY